jgi:hypothetical protein
MGATSNEGVGIGSVKSPIEVLKELNEKVSTIDTSVATLNNVISVVGTFAADYDESFMSIMQHAFSNNGALQYTGGGLFVAPSDSDHSCYFCQNCNTCDFWCCPACICGSDHSWILLAVNADKMTDLAWSGKWKHYNVNLSVFTNLESLWVERVNNSVFKLENLNSLETAGLKYFNISNELIVGNLPELYELDVHFLNCSNYTFDWDTLPNLVQIDLDNNNFSSEEVDNIFISLAASLAKNPRSGDYIDLGGNNGSPTSDSDDAISYLEDLGWSVYY